VQDEAPYCGLAFPLPLSSIRNTRPVAVRRRIPGLQPHQAADEGLLLQYTWILPGIFNPQVNLREHRYFGSPLKDSARLLFDF
jgi:hypothetical protein